MNNTPKFIKLHSRGVEGMISIPSICGITPYNDMTSHVYVNYRTEPLCVDETYEEIKKKLENIAWIV